MKEEGAYIFAAAVLIVVYLASLGMVGMKTQQACDDLWRDQLIKSGHAEYFLDNNNQRQWRMKEAK